MPFKDPEKKRAYDREYRRRRAEKKREPELKPGLWHGLRSGLMSWLRLRAWGPIKSSWKGLRWPPGGRRQAHGIMNDFKPNVLSDVLLAEYVLKNEETEQFKLDPRWNSSEGFDDHVVLYKIALVLIALLNIEGKNPNYYQVRLIFEKAIFTDNIIQKLYFHQQVKSAMDKLVELLDTSNSKLDNLKDQNEKMPWTMTCLRAAKVLENDQAIMHSRFGVIAWGWAMAWLRETGIIETNPATLDLLSMMWINNYLAINNYLNECNPIV